MIAVQPDSELGIWGQAVYFFMNSSHPYWKVSDALFPWFPAKLGFCTIVASNSILTGNEGMPNVCVCSIPLLSYFWYLVVDLMTCVTCDVTHTASLFVPADIFLALVWFMSECLPDPWAVFSLASWGKNLALVMPYALHKRRKFNITPSQTV